MLDCIPLPIFRLNSTLILVDAVKKKQLPAWIREGLNKMEREKQKKIERERLMQERSMRKQMAFEEDSPEDNSPVPVNNPTYVGSSYPLSNIDLNKTKTSLLTFRYLRNHLKDQMLSSASFILRSPVLLLYLIHLA